MPDMTALYDELAVLFTGRSERGGADTAATPRLAGRLGVSIGGTYVIRPPDDPTVYYVRFGPEGGNSFARVKHRDRAAEIPDLEVWVGRDENNRLAIYSPTARAQDLIAHGGGAASIGTHAHDRLSPMPYLSDDRLRLKLNGKIVAGTLRIDVQPGRYDHNGKPAWFLGGSVDFTALLPLSAAQQAWCVYGVDPTTVPASLVALSGSSQSTALPLRAEQIFAVPWNWKLHIAFGAVKLRNGAVALTELDCEALQHTAGGANTVGGVETLIDSTVTVPAGASALWRGGVYVTAALRVDGTLRVI